MPKVNILTDYSIEKVKIVIDGKVCPENFGDFDFYTGDAEELLRACGIDVASGDYDYEWDGSPYRKG